MRTVIIGASHAGIAAAKTLVELAPTMEVVLIERSDSLGFIASTTNLLLDQLVSFEAIEEGEMFTKEELTALGIHLYLMCEVTKITPDDQMIFYTTLTSSSQGTLAYDYLILATGSSHLPLTDAETYLSEKQTISYKNKQQTIKNYPSLRKAEQIGIIGGGLIGFELAESLSRYPEKKITIVERMTRPLFRYFDEEIVEKLLTYTPENVTLMRTDWLNKLLDDPNSDQLTAIFANGKSMQFDACVLAINPKANSDLAKGFLELAFDQTIPVNDYLQTSIPTIYAVGDLIKVPFIKKEWSLYVPLISNAKRTGIIAAYNIISKNKRIFPPIQRSIASQLFGVYLGSSGMTESETPFFGLSTYSLHKEYQTHSRYTRNNDYFLNIKLVVEKGTNKLLGVQLLSSEKEDLQLINQLATYISQGKSVFDLIETDNYFNPKLSPSFDVLKDLGIEGLKQWK